MRSPILQVTLLVVVSLAHVPDAPAQVGGTMDVDTFRPAIDSRGYITVNASQVLGNLDISFGLVTDWGYRVLTLEGGPFSGTGYEAGNAEYRVENVISPTLQAALGLFGIL